MMMMLTTETRNVRFTHEQPDKRADMGLTDNTVANRAKLFDTSSSSSSSHELSVQEFVVTVEAKDNTSIGTCLMVARERASEGCLAARRQQRTLHV